MPVFKKIHYAWIVVGITCLVLLTSAGVRSTPGILMVPLEEEFHWSRATIGFAVSINLLLYGCIGPFAAAVMERFGIRRSVLIALTLVGLGVASTSMMRYPWQLILMWGVLVGVGTGFLATVLSATIAARWFTARRGLAVGILSGGASTGQLIFLPVMANVTAAFGWRTTVLAIAGVLCMVIPLVALIMRDRPQDIGLAPYGETGTPEPVKPPQGNPIALAFGALGTAVRNRDIWLIGSTYFVCGASTNGLIGTHLIPACIDHGMTEVAGAALLATMGFFNFIGTTCSGWLADRFDNRHLLFAYYGLRGLSLLYLPFSFVDFYTMTFFAVFYGLDWFATVAPTVRLVTDKVGREKGGMVYGWVFMCHQLGGASAAFFGGLFRESFGGYTQAFMISGTLCLIAAVAVLFIGGGRRAATPAVAAA
ncbi:MFS transporter [Rhodoplanes sp. Z2-YC6860]|uniref:MFS transporter n=1 Tax=Rhodoplanes sp. Z2-YC6860 TaxID=674703 RepID=UPI00078DD70A|nr:MFS transporter [Rhodoplanes sp. Z2-YC6860]AMN41295.1 major facilitator family transporter [Rhodoplanes sp. Z2-YC6860]